MKTRIALFSLLLALLAQTALAVSCHCFNQRDFDPADPPSVDPYVLATARNTLAAAANGVEKAAVVRLRMGGSSEADVWIGLWAAKSTGRDPANFFAAHEKEGSWPKAFAAMGFDPARQGDSYAALSAKGDEALASGLADEALDRAFGAGRDLLASLRKEGGDTAEIAVALYLRQKAGREPLSTLRDAKAGRLHWGSLLTVAGTPPSTLSARIAEIVLSPKKPL